MSYAWCKALIDESNNNKHGRYVNTLKDGDQLRCRILTYLRYCALYGYHAEEKSILCRNNSSNFFAYKCDFPQQNVFSCFLSQTYNIPAHISQHSTLFHHTNQLWRWALTYSNNSTRTFRAITTAPYTPHFHKQSITQVHHTPLSSWTKDKAEKLYAKLKVWNEMLF